MAAPRLGLWHQNCRLAQLDNVCFLNRPVGVKRFQISLFRVKQHPKIQIANYVPWNVYAD
jgi:hypothetical protein